MNVFDFRDRVIGEYEAFSRSFSKFHAKDIKTFVDAIYEGQHFCPSPLIQLNPSFVPGRTVEQLVSEKILDSECTKIFRIGKDSENLGFTLPLHKHQDEAIGIAQRGESYVLTTGTGSGKSLSYFIPIVDAILKEKKAGNEGKRIRAIIIYPMNALCNSQLEELEKFLCVGYGKNQQPVTFGRYTGQEKEEERQAMSINPPDIILTNFMMLELLMTRQNELDKAIVRAAVGLRFLVLDELHTYRGRQGADVAILVRRVRQAFNANLLCVGTSATMATDGDASDRKAKVSEVAGRLFGADVHPENVITETLQQVTPDNTEINGSILKSVIEQGVPDSASYDELRQHPISIWVELNLGLAKEAGKWVRAVPKTINDAAVLLTEKTRIGETECRDYLTRFLLLSYNTRNENGKSLFAFRLHQFVSGAGDLFTTLESAGTRYLTVDGQLFKPGDRSKKLFNTVYCRECGQEYYPVWGTIQAQTIQGIEPRNLDEKTHEDEDVRHGFFMPDTTGKWDDTVNEDNYPEDWIEYHRDDPRLKATFRKYQPKFLKVNTLGQSVEDGMRGWYIPGNFRFCLNPECRVVYDGSTRSDIAKLASLGTEGRSSSTTILTVSAMRYLLSSDSELSARAKKLLGFSDNRQDASLQAGHFNDFVQILLLRGALLAAVQTSSTGFLTDDVLTQAVFSRLNLDKVDFMANADAPPFIQIRVEQTLRDLLGYRLYFDLRRGWRIMNPNLEQLGLLKIDYLYLDDLCAQNSYWEKAHPLLATASPEKRKEVAVELLDTLRRSLCIKTTYLDRYKQEQMRNASFTDLKEPWGLAEDDKLFEGCYMLPESRPANETALNRDYRAIYLSSRSKFGKYLRKPSTWGNNPSYPEKFKQDDYDKLMKSLVEILNGIIEPLEANKKQAYVLNAAALKWAVADSIPSGKKKNDNRFFADLYLNVSSMLQDKNRLLHQLEAREHTAQVESEEREKREEAFRSAKLPVMFCSPTMELGVDISELNTVYMRNVPPTPANYAQRSGRAGRSGQPALVITYCAAKSPHDQYFFASPIRMVSGSVSPPTLDLANEDLIKSHLHSVWLSETGQRLESSVNGMLALEQKGLPILSSIESSMDVSSVRERTLARGTTILSMLKDELTPELAPWFKGDWLERVIRSAFLSFNQSLERWRTLYLATVRQLNASHAVQMNAAATEKERKEAKLRYNEARTQQELLLKSGSTMTSDFYTYRYLASQGFLPGYNFPRLPLLAFIPARREKVGRDAFLSRSRFLALSEFGPLSLIYHEGSQYRVRKVIVGVRDDDAASGNGLPVRAARICPMCGYGHFGTQLDDERCNSCDARIDGGTLLPNLYRVENVSTRRANRITSDEEERMRLGYETQTTIQYAQENGALQVIKTVFSESGKDILRLYYGPAATVWRINLGWRRRKNKSIYGFNINPNTGVWSKDIQAPDDVDDATTDENADAVQRIIPYVEDRRNVLVIFPEDQLDEVAITTLQYVIKRGIEGTFQLEESELMAEPLPSKDVRNAILFYESAEGGAGVLTRLANDLNALKRVVTKGLEMCHYASTTGRWNPDSIENTHTDCEAGCYRCLLSYYNQPEHDNIDRRRPDVIELLCKLTRAEGRKGTEGRSAENHYDELLRLSGSSLEKAWLKHLHTNGYNLPDRAQILLEQFNTRPDFAYSKSQTVVYIDGPHHEQEPHKNLDATITANLNDAGITVIRFPKEQETWESIISKYPDLFGSGEAS